LSGQFLSFFVCQYYRQHISQDLFMLYDPMYQLAIIFQLLLARRLSLILKTTADAIHSLVLKYLKGRFVVALAGLHSDCQLLKIPPPFSLFILIVRSVQNL
jgi:hypothetical protein